MRVGVLGSGAVGRTLGRGFAERDHEVLLGTRNPEREELRTWAADTGATLGAFGEAAAHGDAVVLALQGTAVEGVLEEVGAAPFAGKTVIDVTNPLDFSGGMPPGLFLARDDSLGERVQRRLPDARVVKCFNTVPNTQMVDPQLPDGPPTMLFCGNDPSAKAQVREILEAFGWPDAIDLGPIREARWLEGFVALWARIALALDNFDHAFRVLR